MAKSKTQKSTFDVSKMLLTSKSSFLMQEAYKTLRTNVTFSLPGSGCKCVGIVSPDRGEGKSTISVNLSISLAQLGKKIVLIDCDMRLPTVAQKIGLETDDGLSNYLSGASDEIQIITVNDLGIDVIPSGTVPPDTTALINSDEMKTMLAFLKNNYDYIILDFPPVNIVSDAVLLSDLIDGYLMVVRHELSEYQKIGEAVRQMRFADAKIIGFVYNGKQESKGYYHRKGKYGKYYKYYNKYYYKKSDKTG